MRKRFVNVASRILEKNSESALFLGDIGVFGFREVLQNYHDRVFNIGILEQAMVGVSAGMASEGIIPTIHTIAPFIVERAYEQIKIDFGYQELPGNLVSVGASFDYAALGCTHHCPADINLISNIPGMNIFIPGHADEFEAMYEKFSQSGTLNYFRLSEVQNGKPIHVEKGNSFCIKTGTEAVVVAVGPILDQVQNATYDMDIELHYVNSFDSSQYLNLNIQTKAKKIILVEPYYSGHLLQSIASILQYTNLRILQIGVPRQFIRKYGNYSQQLEYVGLDANSIRRRIEGFIIE